MDHDSARGGHRSAPDYQAAALAQRVCSVGLEAGLDAVGVAPARHLEPARSVIPIRKERGFDGGMQFTYRNPERSTDPQRSMPARAIVAGALNYLRTTPDCEEGPGDARRARRPLEAQVARYAREDYYAELRHSLDAVARCLRDAGWRADVHADDNHLVDRNVAYQAGLGWYGKNANLLVGEQGSWFVLGSVLTDAPLVSEPLTPPAVDGCGSCRRCIDECPTGAIVGPGIIDARRCLAWIVQGPGPIPVELRSAVGDRIYGCDDCQEVCPPNQRFEATIEPSPTGDGAVHTVDLAFLLEADDATLLERLGRWYIAGRDPRMLRRTALVILGNIGDGADPETRRLLTPYLGHADELLAEHAAWAAQALGLEPRQPRDR